MICVIACMVVVGSLLAIIAKDALLARRETRTRWQMMQTQRLLDAGILRATLRARQDPAYSGETWHPKLGLTNKTPHAQVVISVDQSTTSVTASIGTVPHSTTKSYVFSSSSEK